MVTRRFKEANKALGTFYKSWWLMSFHKNLSETFIEEFKLHLYWQIISKRQKLSEEFVKKNKGLFVPHVPHCLHKRRELFKASWGTVYYV